MTNEVNLGRMLFAMGMRDAFDDHRADFSGISPVAIKDHLHISAVLHKAYLAVDENGAEAAATTAVLMLGGGRPQEPAVFRADHPFLVLLRHNPSGTILFMGRVMNPVAQ
jgi:serpin B